MIDGRTELFICAWQESGLCSKNQEIESQEGPCDSWQRVVGVWMSALKKWQNMEAGGGTGTVVMLKINHLQEY